MADLETVRELLLERLAAAGVDDIRETDKGGRGSCPHCGKDDRFIFAERSDGDGYYVKCHAHCQKRDVLDVLELTWRDLQLSAREGKAHVPELRNPDLVLARAISWAWLQRVPIGKPAINVGNEGAGKGVLTAYLCARWSRGALEGDLLGTPAHVLVIGDEDAVNDTWTPRLHLADADFEFVHFQVEADGDIDLTEPADVEHLRALIRLAGARVVVFDALLDHIGGAGVDEFKPKAVRGALRPLRRLAAEEDVAMLGTLHPRKGRVLSYRDLVANSHQFNAVSRSSLLLAQHPENPEMRVVAWGKGNHAGLVPTLEFRIEPVTFELPSGRQTTDVRAVDWTESTVTIEDAIRSSSGTHGRDQQHAARLDLVLDVLTSLPQSERVIAEMAGVPRTTTQRILRELEELEEVVRSAAGWALKPGVAHEVAHLGEESGPGHLETAVQSQNGVARPSSLSKVGHPLGHPDPEPVTDDSKGTLFEPPDNGTLSDAQALLDDLRDAGL